MLTVAAAIVVPLLLPSLSNGLIGPARHGRRRPGPAAVRAAHLGRPDPDPAAEPQRAQHRAGADLHDRPGQPAAAAAGHRRPVRRRDLAHQRQPAVDPAQHRQPAAAAADRPERASIPATSHQMQVKVGTLAQGYLPVPYPARQVERPRHLGLRAGHPRHPQPRAQHQGRELHRHLPRRAADRRPAAEANRRTSQTWSRDYTQLPDVLLAGRRPEGPRADRQRRRPSTTRRSRCSSGSGPTAASSTTPTSTPAATPTR